MEMPLSRRMRAVGAMALTFFVATASAAPPLFDPIGEEFWISSLVEAVEGEPVEFTVRAVDPDGDPVTLRAVTRPPWADFDSTTGLFHGTPPLWPDDYDGRKNQQGKFDVTFTATDGQYTVRKDVVVLVLESAWTPRSFAEIVASRPIQGTWDPGTPVAIRNVADDTIPTPFAGGKEVRRITFGFTSQVPDVAGWEENWVTEENHAYLPLGPPAAYNAGGVVEGSYAQSWGDTAYGMQACAELDLPVLVIDVDWDFFHAGDVMSLHNEKTLEEGAIEYLFYVYSSAHYIRALDAFVTVIDSLTSWPVSFEDFRVIFTGHSKLGHTCLAAAAVDSSRVVGFMSSGSAALYSDAVRLLAHVLGDSDLNPESSTNYLGTIMRYYSEPLKLQHQARPSLKAAIIQGTRDGVKFSRLCTEREIEFSHRTSAIPNLMHSAQSPHHSIIWRMWLAHCFLDRPITSIDSVTHRRVGDSLIVEAALSGLPAVGNVVLYSTEEPDLEPGYWDTVAAHPMEPDEDVYRAILPGRTTMYYVEVQDGADGVQGLMSTVPTPVNRDYPLLPLAPGGISGFSASIDGDDVRMTWKNPSDEDFAGVLVRYGTGGYPSAPTEGTEVYDGADSACTHFDAAPDESCYYSAFSYDTTGAYSEGATLFVDIGSTVSDSVPPSLFRIEASPNPFSTSCEIEVEVEEESEVVLEVVDVSGRVVKTLMENEVVKPGKQAVSFDGGDLASGLYFVRMKSGGRVTARRAVRIR